MAIKEFKRYERKYLITMQQAEKLLDRIGDRLTPDSYCQNNQKYHIYNIYFDTINNDIIRRSCEKPYFKEKLRFRAYDNFYETGEAFLEIKRKIGKLVIKRRVEMSSREVSDFINKSIKPVRSDMQKINELAYFTSLYKLIPAVFIAYDRFAYTVKDDPQTRITFDSNIRSRRDRLSFEDGTDGEILLDDHYLLLEIKFPQATPLWLSQVLSELNIFPYSYSKYGEEYKSLICSRLQDQAEIIQNSSIFAKILFNENILKESVT